MRSLTLITEDIVLPVEEIVSFVKVKNEFINRYNQFEERFEVHILLDRQSTTIVSTFKTEKEANDLFEKLITITGDKK